MVGSIRKPLFIHSNVAFTLHMKNKYITLFCLLLLTAGTFSCKKEYDNNNIAPLAPSYADIPVTVTTYDAFERFPVIFATAPSGNFSITFSIPADRGTIKEITRVATGANGLTSLQGAASAQVNYNGNATSPATVPIVGNGTNTITYTSSLATYTTYRARVGTGAGAAVAVATDPTAPTQLFYYFVLTLTTPRGDVQVIPAQVRIRVV